MVLPSRDRTSLLQALHSVMGPGQADPDPQHAVDFYRSALTLSWTHMSRVVGVMGAKTIVDYGTRVASRKFSELKLVGVSDEGMDFAALLSSDSGADPGNRAACMEELCLTVFETLRELTGDVIVAPILERLKEQQTGLV